VGPLAEANASRLAEAVGAIVPRLSATVTQLGGGAHRLVARLER